MNFFEGHQITCCGSSPKHTASVSNIPLYYGIQYNHEGRFFLRIDRGQEFRGEGAYAFITWPGAYFEYGSIDGGERHHNHICSYGPRIRQYIDSGLLPLNVSSPLIPIGNPERFLQTILSIVNLVRHSVETPPRAVLLYEELLLQLHEFREMAEKNPPWQAPQLNRLLDTIHKFPQNVYDWQKEADRLHVTLTHFRRLFKNLAGMPPQQYLIQCRLQKAADLLQHTLDSVASIAAEAGIENEFYFSRLFRQKYRVSPTEYRREAP